jgi:predicted small secreted protein
MISRTVLILSLLMLSLSACNTWSGFGQDMQQLGKKIQKQGDKDNKD